MGVLFKEGNLKHILAISLFITLASSIAQASLKVGTYNIRTFDSSPGMTNKIELVKILKKLKFDILGVEEIINDKSFKSLIKNNFKNHKVIMSRCGGAGRQKVGFVYNTKKLKFISYKEDSRVGGAATQDNEGCARLRPAFIGNFKEIATSKNFSIVVVHLKAGGGSRSYTRRAKQYIILENLISELKAKHKKTNQVIVLGDFNTTGYVPRDEDFQNFSDMLSKLRFTSAAEKIDCTSYWSGTNRSDNIEESSILDHIIYPKKFLGYNKVSTKMGTHCAKVKCAYTSASELGISYEQVSDHCPMMTTFN
jgi:endonuclease/exonuclease/phosphatase family metal-dependent hydrolase